MANFLKTLPDGFHTSTEHLNRLPLKMSEKIVEYIQNLGYGCYVDDVYRDLKKFDVEIPKKDIKNVINVLMYIYKTAFSECLPLKLFAQLLVSNTQISMKHKKVLILEYEKYYQKNVEQLALPLQLSRLREMDWKLGVSIASDSCKRLDCGKVVLQLTLDSEKESHREKHTVELSISQFKELYKHFQDMKEILDTL